MNVDIFKTATPQTGEFFSFKEEGAAVQGTYIDRREGVDGFNNQQVIYVLKDSNGKIYNIGIPKSNVVVLQQMKDAKFGEIVGFKHDGFQVAKRGPRQGQKFRVINVYRDAKYVDHEWLASQGLSEPEDVEVTARTMSAPADHAPVAEAGEVNPLKAAFADDADSGISKESLDSILDIAVQKGLIGANTDRIEALTSISAYAELELTEENLPKIIVKVMSYKK